MKFKKTLAMVSVTGILASILTGTAASNIASTSAASKSATSKYKTHLTITISHWSIGQAITAKGDALLSTLQKKFNVTLVAKDVTWSDYKTKINTWAASNTLPDVFSDDAAGQPELTKWVNAKLVKALPSNMNAYPNIKKYLAQSDVQAYKVPFASKSAKYYGVPRSTYPTVDWWANDYSLMYRKDWMKKVGVKKEPTNMTELTSLMKKFVNNDPDGDKKKDTVGLTAYSSDWILPLWMSSEPSIQTYTKNSSGKWTMGFMTSNALKGIASIKKLYDAGGLDRDLATIKGDEGQDKFTQGHAGAYMHSGYPTALQTYNTKFQKTYGSKWNWTDHIALMKPFKATDGNYYHNIQATPWSETYFSSKCSTDKQNRILAILDWGFTDSSEGFKLFRYGIKGKDYTEKNGKITLINTKNADGTIKTMNQKYPSAIMSNWWGWFQGWSYTDTSTSYPGIRKQAKALLDWEMKYSKPIKTNLNIGWLNYTGKNSISNYSMGNATVQAITSSNATAAWTQIVNNFKKNGYTTALASINTLAKKYGMTGYTK
jgi:putative aldouronate transport system substrate-binding protein